MIFLIFFFVRDENGYYQITGRVDDVINVTGHRLGTAEVEDVMVNIKITIIATFRNFLGREESKSKPSFANQSPPTAVFRIVLYFFYEIFFL